MFSLPDIEFHNIRPIKFHRYRSVVLHRIFTIPYETTTYQGKEIEEFRYALHKHFTNFAIKNSPDNKIVFECEMYGQRIFFGFYDWHFSIGFNYIDDNERIK